MLAKAAWQSTQLDCVHIHSCGNGCLGFRFYSGSLWKRAGMPAQPKVTKGLLPHHSAPRLGSVCPNTVLNPWAAVLPGYPRIQACARPAWFNGAPEIKITSRSRARSRAARFASWLPLIANYPCRSSSNASANSTAFCPFVFNSLTITATTISTAPSIAIGGNRSPAIRPTTPAHTGSPA